MKRISTSQDVLTLSNAIKPLLAGQPPHVSGAVLADLVSLWLAGHPASLRDALLEMHIETVLRLIPESEREMFGPAGHPQNGHHGWTVMTLKPDPLSYSAARPFPRGSGALCRRRHDQVRRDDRRSTYAQATPDRWPHDLGPGRAGHRVQRIAASGREEFLRPGVLIHLLPQRALQ